MATPLVTLRARPVTFVLALLTLSLAVSVFPGVLPTQAKNYEPGCTGGVGDLAQLVEAIVDAGNNGEVDTITLAGGCTYTLEAPLVIAADGGNLLTIDGSGATISGGDAVQVLIVQPGAQVSLRDVTVSGGTAGDAGGGIINEGTLTISSSLIADNSAGNGGGIYNNSGALTIVNSTLSGNVASEFGGGIYNKGALTITNSTVSTNSADAGGGIYDSTGGSPIANTIIAGNSASTSPDLDGTIDSLGYNLIGDSSGGSGFVASDLLDGAASPLNLGGLADNGGLTLTMALFSGSVAIDAGDPAFSSPPDFDQRGTGYPRVRGSRLDIGAYEAPNSCPTFPVSISNGYVAGLIAAIECANVLPGSQTINLAALGTYTLTAEYAPGNGLPAIQNAATSGSLIINGNGATLTRSSAAAFRILQVSGGGNLTLNNVIIDNGAADSSGGGGLANYAGTLTINGGAVRGSTTTGTGGGILNGGTLTITGSTISGNTTNGLDGGGIDNFGTLTLSSSTVSGNAAPGGVGGGIINSGTLTVIGSTFSGNSAGGGGGIRNDGGSVSVTNSTFFGNHVTVNGGALLFFHGSASITSSTIFGNSADNSSGGIGVSSAILNIGNTIVAGNTAPTSPDINGSIFSLGFNLFSTTSLNLGPLADNGGPTQTMALLVGSVAIDAGNPAFAPPPNFDQRGSGFPRVGGGRIDIGAYETTGNDLVVHLTLEGRPVPPSIRWVTTNHVQLRPAGGGAAIVTGNYTTDTSGQFALIDLPLGSYTIWVKGIHTLAAAQSVTLESGVNNVTTPTLKEGDANDSNTVTIADFAILAAAFGKSTGQAGYDARADFNQDGAITIADFSLLALNFGQAGVS